MLIENFLAVENGHACDSDHPRMPFVTTGRKTGKSLSWVDMVLSLVLCRDGRVRYGMRGYVAWCFCLLVEVYIVMLIMQGIFKPPKSTIDRVLFR